RPALPRGGDALAGLRVVGSVFPQALPRRRQDRQRVRPIDGDRHPAGPRVLDARASRRRLRPRRRPRRGRGDGDGPLALGRGPPAAHRQRRQPDPRSRLRAALRDLVRPRRRAGDPPRRLRRLLSGGRQHLDRRQDGQGDLDPRRALDGRRRASALSQGRAARRAALSVDRAAPGAGPRLARADRRRDADVGPARAGLAHLRRPRVPQHRRDAGGHRRHRARRPRPREARLRAPRALHRRPVGNDDGMSRGSARSLLGALASVVVAAAVWEVFARSGVFSTALTPSLAAIVPALNRIWIRAAEAMGAERGRLFRKIVLPGALPFVIAGARQAFARSWIAVVGGEMIAATNWGLGWVIFDSKEYLNADVMLATLLVIGLLGLGFERL